jgi:hypothetical protein
MNSKFHINIATSAIYIPVLIASTGSSFEAEIAGRIPDIKPIMAANKVPNRTFPILRTKSKSNTLVNTNAIIQTKNKPIIPPITDNIMASNKN